MITEKVHRIYEKIKSHKSIDTFLQMATPIYFNYDFQVNNPSIQMNKTYPAHYLHLVERMVLGYLIIDNVVPNASLAAKLFLSLTAGLGENALENIIGLMAAKYATTHRLEN